MGHAIAGLQSSDAKIGNLDLAIRQQNDVGGLDVTMHHPSAVRLTERLQHLNDDRYRIGQWQRLAILEIAAQLPALHVFHDDIGRTGFLTVFKYSDDIGMQAATCGTYFAAKAF